jgi:hypothetical protein
MVLRLLKKYRGADFGRNRPRVLWSHVLPQDITRQVNNEQVLVQNGIHSRKRAMDELGIRDPDSEFERWLEEREAILKMNRQFNARPVRSERRERVSTAQAEGVEE